MAAPGAAATLALLAMNWAATGDPRHAGAQLKLLSSNPYLSDVDRARTFVETLVVLYTKALRSELAVHPGLPAVPGLLIGHLDLGHVTTSWCHPAIRTPPSGRRGARRVSTGPCRAVQSPEAPRGRPGRA